MKIIIGLGNPGRLYQKTRHNFGFIVVDALAKELKVKFKHKDYSVLWTTATFGLNKIILAKPNTYVNLSGQAVIQLIKKFKINIKDLLVVVDDVNLEWGQMRLRPSGSAGGHKGLKSIIEALGTNEFARLRLGISGGNKESLTDYVLSGFSRREEKEMDLLVKYVNEAIEAFVIDGVETAMRRFNGVDLLKGDYTKIKKK